MAVLDNANVEFDGHEQWLVDLTRKAKRDGTVDRTIIWVERIVIVVAVLGLWQLFGALHIASAQLVSSPHAVGDALVDLFRQATFYDNLRVTYEEVLIGLVIGIVTGSIVGITFILLPQLSDALQPLIVGANSMPKIALAPLTVVWFGLGIESKIVLAALGVFFLIFFNVISGAAAMDKSLSNNLAVMGFKKRRVVTILVLPSVATWIVTALKVSISVALVGAVVGEYIGAEAGIGYQLEISINAYAITTMFALLLVLAIMGGVVYGLVALLEKRLLRWNR